MAKQKRKSRHITNENEDLLCETAARLSKEFDGTDVIIIAAGKAGTRFDRCTTGSTVFLSGGGRLRDFIGILETAKEIETLKHFNLFPSKNKGQS